ncbi:MAG: serine hydrolase domain-containing protein [Bacteroidota bacterium]
MERTCVLLMFMLSGLLGYTQQLGQRGESISKIKKYLSQQAAKDSLHGTVLIADGDSILVREAYGFWDTEHTQRHSPIGKIGLASMGKMFTGISIMQLASQGKIDLDKSIGTYLQDIKNRTLRNQVTIKELLSHRSGLGSYWGYTTESDQGNLDRLYQLILEKEKVKKNRKFSYSNSGFILLGKLIEVISGMTYEQYVKVNILKPLKMYDTEIGISDGGGNSTVDDLFKFSMGLRNHQLLSEQSFDAMIQDQSNNNYGLGFTVEIRNNHKIYGHRGGFYIENTVIGVASGLDIVNDSLTVIILTNRNPGMGGGDARNFMLNVLTDNQDG